MKKPRPKPAVKKPPKPKVAKPKVSREHYTVAQVAEALEQSAGLRSMAAAKLGCTDQTISGYLSRHPQLRELADILDERLNDLAEGVIIKGIREGDRGCAMFWLKTRARKRGFSTTYNALKEGLGGAGAPGSPERPITIRISGGLPVKKPPVKPVVDETPPAEATSA